MALFSERYGYISPRNALQLESMDSRLRVAIYNELHYFFCQHSSFLSSDICRAIWGSFWNKPIDEYPYYREEFLSALKDDIFEGQWFTVYDLLEFIANEINGLEDSLVVPWDGPYVSYEGNSHRDSVEYHDAVNKVLERECSGYRLVSGSVIPITDEQEIASLEEALDTQDTFSGVRLHIGAALELLSKRPEPDCRNAIKESISAVESVAKVLSEDEKVTLGKALKQMKVERELHPALAEGWEKLYGFVSDEGGIRHAASSDDVTVDYALAKYMLVTCSAFANYLIEVEAKCPK